MQIMVQLKISKFQLKEFEMLLMLKLHHLHKNNKICNINSFDKFLKPIADKDGMIDIEGIFDEEMEVINNIDNFNFDIPFIGGGNIDNKVFESAITFWFKDVDFDGDKVWEYFHMNN